MKIKKTVNNMGFSLRYTPQGNNEYSLALYQRLSENGKKSKYKLVELKGLPLDLAMEQVLTVLKDAGYQFFLYYQNKSRIFHLGEEAGVRLGLLFLAIKPLSKRSRMDAVVEALKEMETEEVYYWFSKCRAKDTGGRACQALRILLAGE